MKGETHPGSWRRLPGNVYTAERGSPNDQITLYYWPHEPLPVGLSLVRNRNGVRGSSRSSEYVSLSHDPSGLAVRKWGGSRDVWPAGRAVRVARVWYREHLAELEAIDWTRSAAEVRDDPAVRALLGIP